MSLRDVLAEPGTWVKIHGTLAVTWALLIIPSVIWWSQSIAWLVLMSGYANFAGSMASLQSARADCNSPTGEDLRRIEQRIIALLRRTSD